jgi:CBS domain containing-hemolysin-like protein
MVPFVVITLLILLNAVFVAAEFALIGVPRAAIEKRASEGHRAAKMLIRIIRDPSLQDRYIATAQIGITFASLGLGMYGEHTIAVWLYGFLGNVGAPSWIVAHTSASALSLILLTYLHIVLGEMVPKSLALQYAERTALFIAPPMTWTKFFIYPLVVGLNALGNGILKMFGVQRQITSGHFIASEELGYLITECQAGGMLREEAGEVLKDLLKFGELTAGEVMVPRVRIVGIPLGSGLDELKTIISTWRHSRYPVYEGDLDHIVGAMHIKDILRLILDKRSPVRDDLREIPYVPETVKLEGVLAAMRRKRTHLAVVMDEFGGTAGLLTIEDLFEEVVGDIEEDVTAPAEAYSDPKGRLNVSGTLRLEEVGDLVGRTFQHEEVITVSGLVLTLLGRRPRVGDVVVYDNIRFEITDVRGRGVDRCVVTVLPDENSGTEDA